MYTSLKMHLKIPRDNYGMFNAIKTVEYDMNKEKFKFLL